MSLNEAAVEDAALEWFSRLGYSVAHGPRLAPGEAGSERASFGDAVLTNRLASAIARLNPAVPAEARDDALRRVQRLASPSLVQTNRAFHHLLRNGVEVEYRRADGSIAGDRGRRRRCTTCCCTYGWWTSIAPTSTTGWS
jgi:type I restriction enzyme R subunit